MQVFQLSVTTVSGNISEEGAFPTWTRDLGVFSSVECAETMIREYVVKTGKSSDIIGFHLREKTLDDSFRGPWKDVCEFQSVRAYLGNGSFHCASFCDSTCEKPFVGREAGTTPFKEGDLVWVLQSSELVPAVVAAIPVLKDAGSHGDYSDDAYMVYHTDGTHSHPQVTDVFPAELGLRDSAASQAADCLHKFGPLLKSAKSDSDLSVRCFDILVREVGLVAANRFIAYEKRQRLDYTEWRGKNLYPHETLESLAAKVRATERKLADTAPDAVKDNVDWFYAHQDELVAKYSGKFLALVDRKVVGVYETFTEGVRAMRDAGHEPGTFAVHHCVPSEQERPLNRIY